MKKKGIVFGTLLAVFLMLMIPNVSALNVQTARTLINKKLDELQEKIEEIKYVNTMNSHILTKLIKSLNGIDFYELFLDFMLYFS